MTPMSVIGDGYLVVQLDNFLRKNDRCEKLFQLTIKRKIILYELADMLCLNSYYHSVKYIAILQNF